MAQSKRWCCTLNNPTDDEKLAWATIGQSDAVAYCIIGREQGAQGTPHLQAYFHFKTNRRLGAIRGSLGPRGHYETARGSVQQNRTYCSKENDYDEYGAIPQQQGTGGQFDAFKEWVSSLESAPTERQIAQEYPSLYVRYSRKLLQLVGHLRPLPVLLDLDAVQLHGWQSDLAAILDEDPDPRKINFVIDYAGNKGKTWFSRYWFTKFPDKTQLLSVGRRDDLAHAIDKTKKFFFLNVPRGSMEFLQYSILESLKDQLVFSPKYESEMKILDCLPHVIVLCNEQPDNDKLSADRFNRIVI